MSPQDPISANPSVPASQGNNPSSTSSNSSTAGKSNASVGSKKENLSALSKQDVVISPQGHSYSKQQIREIQNAIEKGLTCYKSKMEIFSVLKNLDQNVVNLVWQKLEQNNPRFFTAYLIRLAVIKQVKVFQQLVADQNKLKSSQQNKGMTSASNVNMISPSMVSNAPGLAINNNMGVPFTQSGNSIMNSIQTGGPQHSSHMLPNTMGGMNLSLFSSNLMGQTFDQGRRSSITSLTGTSNAGMIPQSVNSNRFPAPMMQFNGTYLQMQPHMNFGNNQQFPGGSIGYQNPNYGQIGQILPQNPSNDQSFNPYSSFGTFSMTGNQGLGHSAGGSASYQMGQQSSHKPNSSKNSSMLDPYPDDVFTM